MAIGLRGATIRCSLLAATVCSLMVACEPDDEPIETTQDVDVSKRLIFNDLAPGLRARFMGQRVIDGLGPNADKLFRGELSARSGVDSMQRILAELMLYHFGNEDGLEWFLDQRGEPAFEYALFPGEGFSTNVAVVPVVRDNSVRGYVFYAGDIGGDPADVLVDYTYKALLEARLTMNPAWQSPQDLSRLWMMSTSKFAMDYLLLGSVDTSVLRFHEGALELQEAGVLRERNGCRGISGTTCTGIWTMSDLVPITSTLDDCAVECYALQTNFGAETCTDWCDEPSEPFDPTGGGFEGGGRTGRQDNDPGAWGTDVCSGQNAGNRSDNGPGGFPGGDLGGNDGPGQSEDESALNEAIARVQAIMPRFDRLPSDFAARTQSWSSVGGLVFESEAFANTLSAGLDQYEHAVSTDGALDGLVSLASRAAAAYAAGGCQQALRNYINDLGRYDWVDYQSLLDACPNAFKIVEKMIETQAPLFQQTLRQLEGPQDQNRDGRHIKFETQQYGAGSTTYDPVSGVTTIRLNEPDCRNSGGDTETCLDLAGTILHEGIHAWMYSKVIDAGLDPFNSTSYRTIWRREVDAFARTSEASTQHKIIAYNEYWSNILAESLWLANDRIGSIDDYKYVAWNGLRQYANPSITSKYNSESDYYTSFVKEVRSKGSALCQ